jgi:(p)ppGpp synthase/HD superfamily hydrolase
MLVVRALRYAEEKHKGQKRRESGHDYITHPVLVSYLLASYKSSKNIEKLIAAAILHDTVEDTSATVEEVTELFGEMVGGLVDELTSRKEDIQKVGDKHEYLKQKMLSMTSYALTIKLVDRLSNIMDCPTEKYVKKTLELMRFLENEREINRTQKRIIADITVECLSKKS